MPLLLSVWLSLVDANAWTPVVQVEEIATGGAPTIVWDPVEARLWLFYEVAVQEAGCVEAWVVRSKSTTDGVDWTPAHRVVGPSDALPCGARRPAALVDDLGARWLFVETADGITALTKHLGAARTVTPLPSLDGISAPSVARYGDEWVLLGTLAGSTVTARSSDGLSWTLDATAALPAGAIPWAAETDSPSLLCEDASTWPWELWFGGSTGGLRTWSWGISEDAAQWYVDAPLAQPTWVSLDVLPMGAERLVAFESLDAFGAPRIGLASTGPLDLTALGSRVCWP